MKQDKRTKTLIILLVVVLTVVVGIILYKTFFKLKDVKSSNDVIDRANAEIEKNSLTLTTAQLNTICEKLYKAMEGLGTDTEGVYAAFESASSRSDVLAIIGTFGVRDGESLEEWLYGDLSGSEIMHLNSILAAKNINYKF